MVWRPDDPQGNEAAKVKHLIVPFTRGKGLDLGCGPWKAWPHFISIDNFDEYRGVVDQATGQHWRPDIIADVTDLSMFQRKSMDFVFSSHLLEHLENTHAVLKEWWRVIKVGGHLVLYLPHKEFYPNIGEEGANPDHHHDFLPEDIVKIMKGISSGWSLVVNMARSAGTEYSFLQIYRKIAAGTVDTEAWRDGPLHDPEGRRRCLVIRYGGFGDMIQSASVLPGLKEQGYRVIMNTTPRGHEIVKHDPHIDDFWLQDIDQVPNEDLDEYWAALGGEFEKVVNLCESVEGALLALPGRRNHAMPKDARHRLMNVNYVEIQHLIAETPFDPKPMFYASTTERDKAMAFRRRLGPKPVLLWALAGSSVHKIWPWSDHVAAWIFEKTPCKIVYVGGKDEQLLEGVIAQQLCLHFLDIDYETSNELSLTGMLTRLKAHFGENRMNCLSGRWSIRETLAFLPHADLIIGPETGVLNAAANLDMPKICMLSHSTIKNLTRDWKNTISVLPVDVACYPCHRIHYDRRFCPQHEETGASVCAASITAGQVTQAIAHAMIFSLNNEGSADDGHQLQSAHI